MDKTTIGVILIVFALVVAGFTLWVTEDLKKLNQFLHKDCSLPADICPFNTLVPSESIIGSLISAVLAGFGVFLIILGKREVKDKIVGSKKIDQAAKQLIGDEKILYDAIFASDGTIFQTQLVEKSNLDKVRVSRALDKLEGKGLIERKRHGMSNVIILKH